MTRKFKPDSRSILGNKKLIEKIKGDFENVTKIAVEERRPIEKQWREIRDIFEMRHDTSKEFFASRYAAFAKDPTSSKALNKLISTIKRNALPYFRPFEARPSDVIQDKESYDMLMASANRNARFLEHQLFDVNKLRERIPVYITQYILYAISVAKVYKEMKTVRTHEGGQVQEVQTVMPFVDFVDIFRWYVFPDKINYLSSAQWIWEWSVVRTARLKKLELAGLIDKKMLKLAIESVRRTGSNPRQTATTGGYHIPLGYEANFKVKSLAARAANANYQKNIADIHDTFLAKGGGYNIVHNGYYMEDIEYTDVDGVRHPLDGEIETVNFMYLNGEVIMARIVDEHPYIVTRNDKLPNRFYQKSEGSYIKRLQYIQESIMAQGLDHMERVGKITRRVDGRSGAQVSGSETPVETIDGPAGSYEQFQLQDNTKAYAFMSSVYNSTIRETLGGAPVSNSQISTRSRGGNTKGGMSLLAEDAQQMILEESMKIEDTLLKPLAGKFHAINKEIQQNMTIQSEDNPLGGYSNMVVKPSDMKVRVVFKWLGSIRVISESQLGEGAINFLAIASKIPPEAAKIDLVRILRIIWGVAFGQRDAEIVIQEPEGQTVQVEVLFQIIASMAEQQVLSREKAMMLIKTIQQVVQQPQQTAGSTGVKSMSTEPMMKQIN